MAFDESLVVLVEDAIDAVGLKKKNLGFVFVKDEKILGRTFSMVGEVFRMEKGEER